MSNDIFELRKALRAGPKAREYSKQATNAFLNPAIENPFGSLELPVYAGSEGIPMSAPRRTTVDAMAPANFIAEEALTPANYVPLGGLGMMRKGAQITQEALPNLNRAKENAGLFLSSPENYIPNFYGPTDIPKDAVPNRFDNYVARDPQAFADKARKVPKVGPAIANAVKGAKTPEEVMQGRMKVQDFAKWAGEGTKKGLFNLMDPDSRALYYSTGVNPTTRDVAQELIGGTQRDLSKALSQGQQNIVTNTRLGREGPVAPALDAVDRISYMSETATFRPGVYSDLVKQAGARNSTPQRDLDFFEEHIGEVWKVGKGEGAEKFADAAAPKINIKTPTTYQTGNHAFDFAHKGPVRTFATLYKNSKNPSNETILAKFKDSPKLTLHPKMGKTDEEILENAKKNGGFYFTGSLQGTAITEGGVNYVGKLAPNGRVTTVVSDENNFLENVPGVGKAVEKALPNRMVNATPPMIFNAASEDAMKLARKIKVPAKDEMTESYTELVQRIAGIKADPKVVKGERIRSAGMLTTGAGVGLRGQQEDKEKGR